MLTDLQRVLLRALTSATPDETLERESQSLSPEDRACVEAIDPEGFLLSSFLVRKLRFERICRGDTPMEEWFERDPERFTRIFEEYNREVPPTEYFPRQEAQAFREYCQKKNVAGP